MYPQLMVNMQTALIFTANNATEKMLSEKAGFQAVPKDTEKLFKDSYKSGMLKDWVKSKNMDK